MSTEFFFQLVIVPIALLLGMVGAQELGVRLRHRHPEGNEKDGVGVVDAAIFALMGLLLAFAFSGAAGRFDERRKLIVQEANDIGTAYMRISLLPAADQEPLKAKFRDYLDARMQSYEDMADKTRYLQGLARSTEIQNEIWAMAVASSQRAPTTVPGMLLLSSLNDMFDTVTERDGSLLMHPPSAVFFLLIAVLLLCSLLAGFRFGASQRWMGLHRLSFVLVLALTYYLIVDLEYPRVGLIRVDNFDQMLVQVRQSMQ